jgi:hypothetical protein
MPEVKLSAFLTHPPTETNATTHSILPDSRRPAFPDTDSRPENYCTTGAIKRKSRQPELSDNGGFSHPATSSNVRHMNPSNDSDRDEECRVRSEEGRVKKPPIIFLNDLLLFYQN